MIEITNLHKSFGDSQVLRGVDLTVHQGESLTVIGGSGSGKSVLLKHIIGLLFPDMGQVSIDGKVVNRLDEAGLNEIRKKFGMLFQGAALFDSLTVWENVGFALAQHTKLSAKEIRELATQKLALVGLKGIEDKMPADLSGGMKKRVGLARAIAMDPAIILYDEPTTGLDPISADAINDLIVDLRKKLGGTSVSITHDMQSAYKISDRIAMLYKGQIQETGTPDEIKGTSNPIVRQFITGSAVGPITAE
ncbi:MAG TPA: ABC transporter ATP-binding protein [Nitrospiraceae bacterium]|nr:ABC transporter ATP-binding protein [Nitrospiraceae bacterium]